MSTTPIPHPSNNLFSDSTFHGLFASTSPEFTAACAHAALDPAWPASPPVRCEQHLMVFMAQCPSTTCYTLFELNRPIMVLAGTFDMNRHPLAFYGLVRGINVWSESDPGGVKYAMAVKVHVRPNFVFNWLASAPWPSVLASAKFIHPHTFLAPDYHPLSLANTPTDEIILVHYDATLLHCMVTSEPPEYQAPNPQVSCIPHRPHYYPF